jgi:hypothetical protein
MNVFDLIDCGIFSAKDMFGKLHVFAISKTRTALETVKEK